ncbi:hypothetical protein MAL01_10180 [Leptospira noguchii]|uniref:hypothetical protein n=1 Tax=Leptospira noguchii TaxID=28182 RepID=UPI001FB8343B|nr:hypothetical protein [Leptospira noguchii]UOG33024.1 hypothetical protein MAL02_09925 [Leptospira noguchii]UOG33034.1 hypothetical protein MAL02_09990 [Leptospira noguchii]UOG43834.1 hypothetical protein MAL01_10115 [Leptospira noguchii]UOG43844.1 hypothetical protein MAL01_10180 [Leptospira noguchii]
MKIVNYISLVLNVLFLGALVYLSYVVYQGNRLTEDSVAYSKKKYAGGIEFLVVRRPQNVLGDFRYFFGARRTETEAPFILKYSPILDSEKDKFEKIENLVECGPDTYVLVVRSGEALSYKKFNIFDTEPRRVEETDFKVCRNGRGTF